MAERTSELRFCFSQVMYPCILQHRVLTTYLVHQFDANCCIPSTDSSSLPPPATWHAKSSTLLPLSSHASSMPPTSSSGRPIGSSSTEKPMSTTERVLMASSRVKLSRHTSLARKKCTPNISR